MATEQNIVFAPFPNYHRFNDMTGQLFGNLTVIGYAGEKRQPSGSMRQFWWCRCKCGSIRKYQANNLQSGNTKGCACERGIVHGRAGTPEYCIWQGMKARCTVPTRRYFSRYGGRGIKVCERWVNSFQAFFEDMGPRPSEKHTLDRIDNDGNYEPSNCRWATKWEQSRNKAANHWITFRGETLCLMDWSKRLGMDYATLFHRIRRWGVERALTEVIHSRAARRTAKSSPAKPPLQP